MKGCRKRHNDYRQPQSGGKTIQFKQSSSS